MLQQKGRKRVQVASMLFLNKSGRRCEEEENGWFEWWTQWTLSIPCGDFQRMINQKAFESLIS